MRLPAPTGLALLTATGLLFPGGLGGCGTDVTPLPEAVALACLTADPLTATETVAEGNVFLIRGGPCGDAIYGDQVAGVRTQSLVTPGLDPIPMATSTYRFSPAGDLISLSNPDGQVYDIASGVTRELFEGSGAVHFLRDRGPSPRVFAVGCGDGEVRVLGADGEAAILAENVVSCPAMAAHAPILIYQDIRGVLHRLDVSSGVDVSLDAILYSDGRTTFIGSGRSDQLVLSSDGEVVFHVQISYGHPQEWATFTRTSTGEPLGAIPNTEGNVSVVPMPGGHVTAVQAGSTLWVLDRHYEFHAYLETSVAAEYPLVNRQLLVEDDSTGEVFIFEPGTGLRGESVADADDLRDLRLSPSGRYVALRSFDICEVGRCEHIVLYDAAEDQKRDLVTLQGDFRLQQVTDTGHVILTGAFRPLGATVTEEITRIYSPDGTLRTELLDHRTGNFANASDSAIFIDSWDPGSGSRRLERIDLGTGAVALLTESLTEATVAGDRLYFTQQVALATGPSQLLVTPF
ncbi:MAG: hypothetical protein JRH11_07280 [Deltaproteobacteria bacterium]|nr:hypothetical protein [Deltaproteobacteria bacterium]